MGILISSPLRIGAVILLGLVCGQGQIVTDGTMGPGVALAGPAFEIPQTLGRTAGNNLFHSFQTFNVGFGESATFSGAHSIANVLARVTGGQGSSIDGTLRCTIPGADLYLVNPAGVVFGPEGKVDVGGSFAVTTADYVELADGGRFDVRNPANDVLTVAPPSAFGFLTPGVGLSIAGVSFQGSQVELKEGHGLTIAAGEVRLDAEALVRAPGGELQVAAVGSEGDLSLAGVDGDEFTKLGNIVIAGDSLLSVSSDDGGGHYHIVAEDLLLEGKARGSGLVNNTRESGVGGNSEILLRGTLRLTDESFISSSAAGTGQGANLRIRADRIEMQSGEILLWSGAPALPGDGDGGSLSVEAREMHLTDWSSLSANTYGAGQGGDIDIHVVSLSLTGSSTVGTASANTGRAGNIRLTADTIQMSGELWLGFLPLPSQVASDATGAGRAGDVVVAAREIEMAVAAIIASRTFGTASAGEIFIRAANTLHMEGYSSIAAVTDGLLLGADAGSIDIEAHEIRLLGQGMDTLNNPNISTSAYRVGKAGPIQIAADTVTLRDGAHITSSGSDEASGGQIQIQVQNLEIMDGYIDTSAFGQGTGGTIGIDADRILLDGMAAMITSRVRTGTGRAGDIQIRGAELILLNDATLSSTTFGAGVGGTIAIDVGRLEVTTSEISAKSLAVDTGGNAGAVVATAREIHLTDFGSISTSTRGTGLGGRIVLEAETILLDNFGVITAETTGAAAGGQIVIFADSLSLDRGARISTESRAAATGAAGDIEIVTGGGIRLAGLSRISSSAVEGKAGSVTLQSASRIDFTGGSRVSVASEGNDAGTVHLLAPDYILLRNSRVSAEAYLDGGNIILIDPTIFGLEGSGLYAHAIQGNGGHIEIVTDFMYRLGDWDIRYDSANQSAQPGTLSIRSGVDFAGSLLGLPGGLIEEESRVREGCARRNPHANSFVVRGKGGVSRRPDGLLTVDPWAR
jgi:filamentous hemagglutinin family protein